MLHNKNKRHGYYWEVKLNDETVVQSSQGYKTAAECIYHAKRLFKGKSHVLWFQVKIRSAVIYSYSNVTQQEDIRDMSWMSEIEDQQDFGVYLPFIDQKEDKLKKRHAGPGKDFLVRSGLLFTVKNVREQKSNNEAFLDQILYDITFVKDNNYEKWSTIMDLEPAYTLGLPKDNRRVKYIEGFNTHSESVYKLDRKGKYFLLKEVESE